MTQPKRTRPRKVKSTTNPTGLRESILTDLKTLKVPLTATELDEHLTAAEREGRSHLEFLRLLLADQAGRRRERSVERRIHEAKFEEHKTLEGFDWQFNAKTIDRSRIEELATGDFIRRQQNVIFCGQSGVGKSHLLGAIGLAACVGYRVRYTTSAALITDLSSSLADQTLPKRLRHYKNFELLIIDEFGFDKVERTEYPHAASLLYKVIDARGPNRSTALVTNIDFDAWGSYLGDEPLAMALLDRLVDGAIILKITGKSYRAHRAKHETSS